jgi:DNA-binding response OmpR family regulator
MRAVKNIMVFDNDKYFLFMLKGYCYANDVRMVEAEFNIDGIKEVQRCSPGLILISLDLISSLENKSIETDLLRLACKDKEIKIYGLNKRSGNIVSADIPEWIDSFVNNPMNISEIDKLVKFVFRYNGLQDRRIHKERRIIKDRRQDNINNSGYAGNQEIKTGNPDYPFHENGKSQDFYVDTRNKCLILKGHKIDLTPKEFELIEYLSTDPDRIFTPDEIVKHLWPENHRATKSDLYQYIHLLRKKIEKDHNQPQLILNAKGFGYKLNLLSRQASTPSFASPGQNRGKVTQMESLQVLTALS